MYCKANVRIVGVEDKKAKDFGKGIVMLLERVAKIGTIKGAAADMGMSSSKAWTILNAAEQELGVTLLMRETARGAELTQTGRELIALYHDMLDAAQSAAEKVFQEYMERIQTEKDDSVPIPRKRTARRMSSTRMSTENRIPGIVSEIQEGPVFGVVKIDTGGGHVLSSIVRMKMIQELGLEPGLTVFAVVNETAVMLAVD